MRPLRPEILARLRVTPDPADTRRPARKAGTRRPHGDGRVEAVRRLIVETALTYSEIAARTGVGRASICRWTQQNGWERPITAPIATDRVRRPRASARLKRRTLAARLQALAERMIGEMESAPAVDPDALAAALEVLKMAKLAALGRRRRRKPAAIDLPAGMRPISELMLAGVDLERAPEAAVKDYLKNRAPPAPSDPDFEARTGRPRGRRRRLDSYEHHLWMLEKE